MTSKRLHLWESALLMAFAAVLLIGCCCSASRAALAGQVLRLHVVANSDSQEDQAVKLQVRDAVLEQARPLLTQAADSWSAAEILRQYLPQLEQTARQTLLEAGHGGQVRVAIEDQWFPTKHYDGFSLPAGEYQALRVVIGEGEGQNWWCVVFPPLCFVTVTEEVAAAAVQAGLTEDQVSLMTGQDGTYVLRFKLIEWWEEFLQKWKEK